MLNVAVDVDIVAIVAAFVVDEVAFLNGGVVVVVVVFGYDCTLSNNFKLCVSKSSNRLRFELDCFIA